MVNPPTSSSLARRLPLRRDASPDPPLLCPHHSHLLRPLTGGPHAPPSPEASSNGESPHLVVVGSSPPPPQRRVAGSAAALSPTL
ncbi:hypothetical protein ABZP36_009197 [Zizania latifolia]